MPDAGYYRPTALSNGFLVLSYVSLFDLVFITLRNKGRVLRKTVIYIMVLKHCYFTLICIEMLSLSKLKRYCMSI